MQFFWDPIALATSTCRLMLCLHMENSNTNICKIMQSYNEFLLRYFYAGNTFGSSQFSLTLTTKVAMSSWNGRPPGLSWTTTSPRWCQESQSSSWHGLELNQTYPQFCSTHTQMLFQVSESNVRACNLVVVNFVSSVFPEHWTYPPFSAHKDEKGDIYGRGTQV